MECVLPSECCASHGLKHCPVSRNHPAGNAHDYAIGKCLTEEEELVCYDWCCEENEFFCEGSCVPDGTQVATCEPTTPPNNATFPKTCCCEEECCDSTEIYMDSLQACCEENTVITPGDATHNAACCCSGTGFTCCPNLTNVC